jgi:hypothetical protein
VIANQAVAADVTVAQPARARVGMAAWWGRRAPVMAPQLSLLSRMPQLPQLPHVAGCVRFVADSGVRDTGRQGQ